MDSSSKTYKQLIKSCIKGDTSAQKVLYETFSQNLYLICLRYSKNKADAQDLLHDCFIHILHNLKKFKFKGSFEGWLKKVTINHCLAYIRKNNILNESVNIEEVPVSNSSTVSFTDNQERNDLLNMVNLLSTQKKIIFNLFAIEGYKHKEIAELLGITEKTSSSIYFKAKEQLKKIYIQYNKVSA